MADFFEPPPPSKYVFTELPQEDWMGPPRDGLPTVVPVERVIAKTKDVALYLANLWVFATGFEFEVFVIAREGDGLDPYRWEPDFKALEAGVIPAEQLRLGIEFPDGSTATNLREGREREGLVPKPPVMTMRGGLYSGDDWEQRYWVWPLPPPGPLTLVCEWPAAGVPLTRLELDSAAIRAAADRVQQPFSTAG
ncbi:MAG: hypothetical protein ACTHN7_12195 [Solirubrobacterales bacterium]